MPRSTPAFTGATRAQPLRLVVIGNSGSGKSTVANKIGASHKLPTLDLDEAFWRTDSDQRAQGEAVSIVAEFSLSHDWIVEGVYEFLLEIALARATQLLWLDLSWDECRKGLLQRGWHYGMDPGDPSSLQAWADAHQERLQKQAQLYEGFQGRKSRLKTRKEVSAVVDGHLLAG